MISVDDRDFQAAYKAWLDHVGKQTRAGLRRYAEAVVEAARSHIHSESGELAGSLGIEDHLDQEPPSLEVGAFESGPEPHALETEFGTSHESPRPFMRPALLEAERAYKVDP